MMLISLVIGWRVALLIVASITHRIFLFKPQFPYSDVYLIHSGLPAWIWSWANFDGVHYLTIAKEGYFARFTQAFFPLYPMTIRMLAAGENSFIITGLYISFFSLILALVFFRNLLLLDYKKSTMRKTILFLLFFPLSFYFGALYTESLFFLFIIAAFLFARKRYWWISGVLGALASATRITGIFLLPALVWEYYISNERRIIPKYKNILGNSKLLQFISCILHSPVLYLIPIGLVIYMFYLQKEFGDAFYFWHAQSVFGAERASGTFVFPLQVIYRYIKIISTVSWSSYGFWVALGELSAFTVCIVLLVYGHAKKIRLSYLIFSWLVISIPTFTGTFSSLPRYILMAFPIFIVAGLLRSRIIVSLIWTFSVILLIVCSSLFLRGLWVA